MEETTRIEGNARFIVSKKFPQTKGVLKNIRVDQGQTLILEIEIEDSGKTRFIQYLPPCRETKDEIMENLGKTVIVEKGKGLLVINHIPEKKIDLDMYLTTNRPPYKLINIEKARQGRVSEIGRLNDKYGFIKAGSFYFAFRMDYMSCMSIDDIQRIIGKMVSINSKGITVYKD